MWVSPFRDPRIKGYVRLPAAYRSLSRLSSALSAKASALRPFCLIFSISIPCILAYMQRWLLLYDFDCFDVFLSSAAYVHLPSSAASAAKAFICHMLTFCYRM